MKTILHMSDMHFGRISEEILELLFLEFCKRKPSIVVISGDLTQRAKISEFKEARAFLDRLTKEGIPVFTVPGNHDIYFWNSPMRYLNPFKRYRQYINEDISPRYLDDEIAITGLNTVRIRKRSNGVVSKEQLVNPIVWFSTAPREVVRILVSHHPLNLPMHIKNYKLARNAKKAVYPLADSRIDIYLSGHYHRSSSLLTSERYPQPHHVAVSVQAGTISERIRGEGQSFNLLTIDRPSLIVETVTLSRAKKFESTSKKEYQFS